jgi:hypothetical protein
LPDPLTMFDGRQVTSREQWVRNRRPELIRLFQHYMYGELPAAPKTIETLVERVDGSYFGGKATKKEVTISFGPPGTPKIRSTPSFSRAATSKSEPFGISLS